jgi:DNA-binding transcriptional ArsR family regulator
MVVDERETERADLLFHALCDRTRREIVTLVLTQEQSVTQLARRFPMSFAAVQKHVVVLERAGLVSKRKDGREQLVRGNQAALAEARQLLDQLESLWRQRFDQIGDLLAASPEQDHGGTT